MSYKIIGHIKNIPDFTAWTKETVGANTLANSPDFLRKAKIAARQWPVDYLVEKYGYPKVDVTNSDPPDPTKWTVTDLSVMHRIGDILGFHKPGGRVQVLQPGCMIPIHNDNLELGYITSGDQALSKNDFTDEEIQRFYDNQNSVGRVLIMLEDWKPGQLIWFYDEKTNQDQWWARWKAGEVAYWEHYKESGIHATMNFGYWTRALLRLSGFKTDRLTQFIDADTPFEIDYNLFDA